MPMMTGAADASPVPGQRNADGCIFGFARRGNDAAHHCDIQSPRRRHGFIHSGTGSRMNANRP
jgi:hypothetical protein